MSVHNKVYQWLRRRYFSSKIPALPLTLVPTPAWFTYVRKERERPMWLAAPSKKQIGALRRTLMSEISLFERLFRVISSGSGHFVDVGANIGYSTLMWADVHKRFQQKTTITYSCIEPNIRNLPFLEFNLRNLSNVMIFPFALGGGSSSFLTGGISMSYGHRGRSVFRNTGLFSFHGKGELASASKKSAPMVSAKVFLEFFEAETVAFCKIDIEGGELNFLFNAERWFKEGVVFQVEINSQYFTEADWGDLENWLIRFDYCVIEPPNFSPESQKNLLRDVFLAPVGKAGEIASAIGWKIS